MILPGSALVVQVHYNTLATAPRADTTAVSLALADAEMQKSFASADFKEGVAHFMQKRAPAFTGA